MYVGGPKPRSASKQKPFLFPFWESSVGVQYILIFTTFDAPLPFFFLSEHERKEREVGSGSERPFKGNFEGPLTRF